MKPIIIVDIDGTVSVVGDRRRFIEQTPPDWERFYLDDFDDLPVPGVCAFVRHMAKTHEIYFCTSRSERVRQKTQLWLRKNLGMEPSAYTLIMRDYDDDRPDVVQKYDQFLRETDETERERVAFVLEDSAQMAKMWRHHGYLCFQAA